MGRDAQRSPELVATGNSTPCPPPHGAPGQQPVADEGLSQGTETPFFCPKMGQALGTATLEGSLHLTVKSLLLEPALCCSFPFFLLPSLPYWFLLGDPTPDRPLCRAAAPSRLCPEVGQRVSPPTCGFPGRGGSGPHLTIRLAPVVSTALLQEVENLVPDSTLAGPGRGPTAVSSQPSRGDRRAWLYRLWTL